MGNEIVKKTETALAETKLIAGMENIDHEDIILPAIFPDGKMGFFRDSLDEKSKKDELTGVLLTYNKGWKLREGDPPKTICRSFFGDYGTSGMSCDGCPRRIKKPDLSQEEYALMETDKILKYKQEQKDFCKRVYDFLFVPDGQDMPAVVSISSITSLGNIKKYLTLFAKKLQRPLFSANAKLSLVETKNPKGQTYFVVQFEKLADLTEKEQAKYAEVMAVYRMNKPVEEIETKDPDEELGTTPF